MSHSRSQRHLREIQLTDNGMYIGAGVGPPPASVPDAFGDNMWVVNDRAINGQIRIDTSALPGDGGSAITDTQYQIDGGSWISMGPNLTTVDVAVSNALHSVRVRAVNSQGNGPASNAKSVTATAPAPAAFGNGNWGVADLVTDGDVRVTVTALPSLFGSTISAIEYSIDGGGWLNSGITAPGNFDISGLNNGQSYSFQIRAVSTPGGNGAASSSKSVTPTAPATVPAQFGTGDWSITDLGTAGDARINITALPSDGGSTITDLQYQKDGGAWVSLGGISTGNYDLSVFTDGVAANVAIRAVNAVGNGTASSTKSVTTTAPAVFPTVVGFYTGADQISGATAVACQVGDVFVAYVYRTTSNTTPASLPTSGQWVNIGTRTGTTSAGSSARFLKAVAIATTIDISQQFANATSMIVVHLRPPSGKMLKIGQGNGGGNGSGTTITVPASSTFEDTSGSSLLLMLAGVKGQSSNINVAPSGFTNIGSALISTTDEISAHITSSGVTGYSGQSYAIAGVSGQGFVHQELEVAQLTPPADQVDLFNRADENLGNTGPWALFTGSLGVWQVKSNKLSYIGTSDTVMHFMDTKSSDHFVEATVEKITGSSGNFPLVCRLQDIDNYLGLRWNNATLELVPRLAASFDLTLPGLGTVAIGDLVRLRVRGGTAEVLVNGVSRGTYSGSFIRQLTSNKVGVVGRNLTQWDPIIDNWKAGLA